MLVIKKHRTLHSLIDEIFDQADANKISWPVLARKAGLHVSTVYRLGTYQTSYPRVQTVWMLAAAAGIQIKFTQIIQPLKVAG